MDPIIQLVETEKQTAYRTIVQNKYITNSLRELFMRIFLFTAAFVPGNDMHSMLSNDQPQLMAGWIPIENDTDLMYLLNGDCNQRELLTSIYRLALNMPRIICDYMIHHPDAINILKMLHLDYSVFKRKISSILYQYNLLEDNMSETEMLQILRELYHESQEDMIHRRQLMYGFTTPHGYNPVSVFKNSRVTRTQEERQFMFPVSTEALVERLSEREEKVMGLPRGYSGFLPWITGNMIYGVGINSMFHKYAAKNNKAFATGVSGSTQVMLECASLFGVDVRSVFLALLPWMDTSLTSKDHTIFEIVFAAQPHLPVNSYKVSADNIIDLTELKFIDMIYQSIPNPADIPQPMEGVVEQVPVAQFPKVLFGGQKSKIGGWNATRTSELVPKYPIFNTNIKSKKSIVSQTNIASSNGRISKKDTVTNMMHPCMEAASMFMITSYDESLMKEWKFKFNIDITPSQLLRIKAEKAPSDATLIFLPVIYKKGEVERNTRKILSEDVWKTVVSLRKKYNKEHKLRDESEPWETNPSVDVKKENSSNSTPLFSFAKFNVKKGGKHEHPKKRVKARS